MMNLKLVNFSVDGMIWYIIVGEIKMAGSPESQEIAQLSDEPTRRLMLGIYGLVANGLPIIANTAATLVGEDDRCTVDSRSRANGELERLVVSGLLRRSEHFVIGGDHLQSYELPL